MRFILGLTSLLLASAPAHSASLPDDHAPIGVMGDHTHKPGEWMLSYRYARMEMNGNRDGTSDVSTAQVLNDFVVAPLDMTMDMHMFGAMYGVTDDLTLMGMVPYVRKSMNHVNRMGVHFETETEGLGDGKLSGTYVLYRSDADAKTRRTQHTVLLNLGVSLPTGSVDERDDTPAGANQKLPYPMQLGSGTFDPLLGLTYLNKHKDWSLGGQANAVLRFGKNDEGYRLGNEYAATAWAAYRLGARASVSFRLDGKAWGNIHGRNDELSPTMVPTARADLRGGERIDALVGINLVPPEGALSGHRLAAEFGFPLYQHLDGPQLEMDYRFLLGWQWAL